MSCREAGKNHRYAIKQLNHALFCYLSPLIAEIISRFSFLSLFFFLLVLTVKQVSSLDEAA